MPRSAIGIFDSGIGGLTVLKALCHNYPNENFIYLGDTARLPYGSKSPQTIRKYSEQNVQFLIHQKVKAIVIACNSASTQFPEKSYHGVPIYNVIDPGSAKAIATTKNKRIGVIGTRATISSDIYRQKIKALDSEAQVFSQHCPLFVPLAEEGWHDDPITSLISFRYLQNLLTKDIDVLIMGCTHYPLLKKSLSTIMGPDVALVDSGQTIAENLGSDFQSGLILETDQERKERMIRILTTDPSPILYALAEKILSTTTPLTFETVDI